MKKKNGFTLVELLVVIVILGVVTGISIPLIRNIQENNKKRQYTTYADSLKQSAKLYIDSYGEDLFGKHASGCTFVSYNDMKERGYIKDIQVEGMSCNSNSTFVKIVKTNNKYVYTTYLGCGTKKNDKADSVSVSYPEAGKVYEMDSTTCNMKGTSMTISMGTAVSGSIAKVQVATVAIVSPTGINSNASIYATWSKTVNFESASWIKANMSIPVGQAGKISAGENIYAESQQFVTPTGDNGNYYLLVKVENLEDLSGAHWKNTQTPNSPYLYFGPVKVDNTNPTCQLKVTTSGVAFNTKNDNIELKDFGLGNSATANYNSKTSLSLANGTFYGYVRDTAGNVGSCSANLMGTVINKYTKVSTLCSGTAPSVTGNYQTGSITSHSYRSYGTNLSACQSRARKEFSSCDQSAFGKENWYLLSFHEVDPTEHLFECVYRIEQCVPSGVTLPCTLDTCTKIGCKCTGGYNFGSPVKDTNATECTGNTFDNCDASHNGQSVVTCTPTGYACSNSAYTKLNDTYCYKIN